MRNIATIICILVSLHLVAQIKIGRHIDIIKFGVSPELLASTPKGNYLSDVGFGASGYIDTEIKQKFRLDANFGFQRLAFQLESPALQYSQVSGFLSLGTRFYIPGMDGASLKTQIKQNYLTGYSEDRSLSVEPIRANYYPTGLYLGMEFGSITRSTFEFGYEHILNQIGDPSLNIGNAHNIRFKYNINFLEKKNKSYADYAFETLEALQNDTLYFVNKSCPSDFSDYELEIMLKQYYDFSAFKVISAEQMDSVSKQYNTLMFAIIGAHYASPGDPETVGIFLLDKNLNNAKFPFPYSTNTSGASYNKDDCISDLTQAKFLIHLFNGRMYSRNHAVTKRRK